MWQIRLRHAFAAQLQGQTVQGLPAVVGPIGLFETLHDAIHQVRGLQ